MIRAVFAGRAGPAADMVALNAGAALYAGDVTATLSQGVELARQALVDGAAARTVEALARFTA
jgi:anthranilate phosphoribosyltransferase